MDENVESHTSSVAGDKKGGNVVFNQDDYSLIKADYPKYNGVSAQVLCECVVMALGLGRHIVLIL